jgi:hypothetical protein
LLKSTSGTRNTQTESNCRTDLHEPRKGDPYLREWSDVVVPETNRDSSTAFHQVRQFR